jgi:hypothetical protein
VVRSVDFWRESLNARRAKQGETARGPAKVDDLL